MAVPFHEVSVDAAEALTEFSLEFASVFSSPDAVSWVETGGRLRTSNAIKTVYPIPVSAAGYVRRKGDDPMRRLYARSMSMTTEEWVDGVSEKWAVVRAPDFTGWNDEPARIAEEARRFPNTLVASLLEANGFLDFYRVKHHGADEPSTIRLFAGNHPVNVDPNATSYGTFDNDFAAAGTGLDITTLSGMKQYFRAIKKPNGTPFGLRLTHLIVSSALEEIARDLLESDLLLQAVSNVAGTETVGGVALPNRHRGTVQLVVADELTSDQYVYGIANNGAVPAWIVQTTGAPEEIRYDLSSDYYKDSGQIGVKYVLNMAAAGCLPHGICRVDIS